MGEVAGELLGDSNLKKTFLILDMIRLQFSNQNFLQKILHIITHMPVRINENSKFPLSLFKSLTE